jgi:hypothetical protein
MLNVLTVKWLKRCLCLNECILRIAFWFLGLWHGACPIRRENLKFTPQSFFEWIDWKKCFLFKWSALSSQWGVFCSNDRCPLSSPMFTERLSFEIKSEIHWKIWFLSILGWGRGRNGTGSSATAIRNTVYFFPQ